MENMKIKNLKGDELTHYSQVLRELHPDGQGSGTAEGTLLIGDIPVFVRKHWSYAGGFPFSSEILVGEIVLDGGASYCEGERQELFDEKGFRIKDAELSVKIINR